MNFKFLIHKNFLTFALSFLALINWSCSKETGDSPYIKQQVKSTVLVYAVATNSLSGNLVSDKNEMLLAAVDLDVNQNNVLVFETKYGAVVNGDRTAEIRLLRLVKSGDSYVWNVEKEFTDDIDPLNPSRVSEVIDYVANNYKAENYGLVFWSHSTGSQPYTYNNTKADNGLAYSFGQDLTAKNDEFIQINIDELAKAVPDRMFDFIWFDSCYMSNIESIYEFRNKCNTYVGYATEVLEYGLPYNIVLPYMVGENPDLISAADLFYQYYQNSIATIAVVDMNKIENFAQSCRTFMGKNVEVSPSSYMKYTRFSTGPFYELGDYAKDLAVKNGNEISEDQWNELIDNIVIYKAATPRDFSYNTIYPERFSGLSTHVYSTSDDSESEIYYKSLGWYKAVFE